MIKFYDLARILVAKFYAASSTSSLMLHTVDFSLKKYEIGYKNPTHTDGDQIPYNSRRHDGEGLRSHQTRGY